MYTTAGSVSAPPPPPPVTLFVTFAAQWFWFWWLTSCPAGLSPELEKLMVEGLLLQVQLPEVPSLYCTLLDKASSLQTDRCTSPPPLPPQDESTDCEQPTQFNSQGNNLSLDQVQTEPLPLVLTPHRLRV